MEYLTANYCPTLPEDSEACDHDISRGDVGMLYSIVNHYFVDGAVHVCQTMGVCDARSPHTDLRQARNRTYAPMRWAPAAMRLLPTTSPPCMPWLWRSSSSLVRSATRSLYAPGRNLQNLFR